MESQYEELVFEAKRAYAIPGFTSWPAKPGGLALDLGSNEGAFAAVFGDRFDEIVGIDANVDMIARAEEACANNSVQHVKFFNYACSSTSGKQIPLRRVLVGGSESPKDYSTFAPDDASSNLLEWQGSFSGTHCMATSINFAGLMGLVGHKRVRFLKIDIEGAEYDLLAEADLDPVDCIALECHRSFLGRKRTTYLINQMLRTHRLLASPLIRKGHWDSWPPPDLLWLVHRRFPPWRWLFLSALSRFPPQLRR